ncbi:MAG: hypothetical protein NT031_10255 [Planctomycetota bacterium]|nr:hypothetical protein [Planctomycetota bacterium]
MRPRRSQGTTVMATNAATAMAAKTAWWATSSRSWIFGHTSWQVSMATSPRPIRPSMARMIGQLVYRR